MRNIDIADRLYHKMNIELYKGTILHCDSMVMWDLNNRLKNPIADKVKSQLNNILNFQIKQEKFKWKI